MTPTLAQALSLIAPAYSAREHTRAAERMVQDMEKTKLTGTYKDGPSPCDVSLVVRGPRQASNPEIDYPQNYVIIPESSLQSGNGWTIYAICQNPRAAALFAASPDLLRALEDALPTLQSHMERYPNDKDERRIYDAARAAIAKARGE